MFLQPTDEFEQRGQIDGGLQTARHPVTEVGIDHPRRNGLPDFGTLEIEILHVPATEFTHNGEVMLAKKGMKRIPNRDGALVTGIMTCRLQRVRSHDDVPFREDTLKRELQRGRSRSDAFRFLSESRPSEHNPTDDLDGACDMALESILEDIAEAVERDWTSDRS